MKMESKEHGVVMTYCTFVKFGIAYNKTFQQAIWPLMDLMFSDILPMGVISVCVVLWALKTFTGGEQDDVERAAEVKNYFIWGARIIKQLLAAIALLGLFYVALNLPQLAWRLKTQYTYDQLFKERIPTVDSSYHDYALSTQEFDDAISMEQRKKLVGTVVAMVRYVFLSLKFFVYISVSSKFRQEFRDLWRCKRIQTSCGGSSSSSPGQQSVPRKNTNQEAATLITAQRDPNNAQA
jgi:hypothetical protein